MSRKEKRRYASARERADKVKQGFKASFLKVPEGVQFFEPKAGRFLLDILPYTVGEGNKWAEEGALYYERTFYLHRNVGANQETLICPRMTAKQPCPICEHRARLMRQNDEDNEELIQSLAPKERQIFNVINLKEPDKGVQLFTSSYHTFGKLLDTRLRGADEEDNWDGFFTLEDGLTLKVVFSDESAGGYSFVSAESMDFRSRREPYDEDILKDTLCLDDLLIIPEYDDLKKTFLETETEDDEDEDEKPKRHRRQEEDEDDDEEEPPKRKHLHANKEADDDDEDEEEKPKRRAPKDEDEDWDDEDEEEDEPKSKRKAPKDDDDEWEEVESKSKKKPKNEDDEEEEDEEPAKKKGSLFPRGKGKVRTGAKDDDEEDED